jgi:hypothetical protein
LHELRFLTGLRRQLRIDLNHQTLFLTREGGFLFVHMYEWPAEQIFNDIFFSTGYNRIELNVGRIL